MEITFPLPDLARAVERVLAGAPAPADERVSAAPDLRTLRWYQTTGLLDRPLRYDGRNAVYGWRHLLQAAAVKLLQGQGKALAEIQAGLAGAPTDALEAAVAEAVGADTLAAVRADLARPAPLPSGEPVPASLPAPPAPLAPVAALPPLLAVEVAPGITVLVDTRVHPAPDAVLARIRTLFPVGGPR